MKAAAAYFAERFPLAVFAPALALMVGAAAWTTGTWEVLSLARASALAMLLVASFRLWDDLEDVARDRVTHPERVLVGAPAAPFRVLCAGMLVSALLLCLGRGTALAAVAGFTAGFWLAYRTIRPRVTEHTWNLGVLLLKYPGFVAAVSLSMGAPHPRRLAASAGAAYLCASGYELWHTRREHLGVAS